MSTSHQRLKRISILLLLITLSLGFFAKGIFSLGPVPAIRVVLNFVQLSACVTALTALCLSDAGETKRPGVSMRGYGWVWLSWLVLSSSAVALSQHFYPSLLRQIEVLVSILLSCLLLRLNADSRHFGKKVTAAVSLAIVLSAAVELVGYFYLTPFQQQRLFLPNTLLSYFSVRHLGHLAAVLAVLSVYYLRSSRFWVAILGSLLLLVALVSIFLCGGKASSGSVLLLLAFFAIASKKKKLYLQFGAILSSALILSFRYFSSENGSQGIGTILNVFTPVTSSTGTTTSNIIHASRYDIWETSWLNSIEFPVLGLGPDGYVFIQPHIWGQTPHNFVLQFAIEWGWPAAFIASAFFIKRAYQAVLHIWTQAERPSLSAYWSAAFLVFFLNGLVSSTFYQPVNMLMLAIIAGFCPVFSGAAKVPVRKGGSILTPKLKGWLVILFLTGGFAINLVAFFSIMTLQNIEEAPEPDSAPVQLVQDFPFSLLGYYRWVKAWEYQYPEVIVARCQWAAKHTEYMSWPYYALESRYQRRAFHFKSADFAAARAYESAGKNPKFRLAVDKILKEP